MESYFRLDTPLYFSYSHLVCRTAIEGELSTRCGLARVLGTRTETGYGPLHPSWGASTKCGHPVRSVQRRKF